MKITPPAASFARSTPTTPKPGYFHNWFDGRQAGTLPLAIARLRRWNFLVAFVPLLGLALTRWLRHTLTPSKLTPTSVALLFVPAALLIIASLLVRWLESRLRRNAREADNIACDSCVYDLRNLPPTGRCPECGRAYDTAKLVGMWEAAARSQSITG